MRTIDCYGVSVAKQERKSYAEELASETFGLPEDKVTPASIRALTPVRGLRLLTRQARLGGRLTGHLTRLTDEEHEAKAARAREFLQRPPIEYPADDIAHEVNDAEDASYRQ
jgi:hypothetical protein